jgi:PAS domain S-box-containing protein
MIRRVLQQKPHAILAYGAILIAVIAVADWHVAFNVTLGFLYIFPLVLIGTVLSWWQLIPVALLCTLLSDQLDPFPMEDRLARDVLIFLTLSTTGLLSLGVTKGYRAEMASRARLEREMLARRAAEGQLEFLIESSPAAVVTMNAEGQILLANPAAHRLLGVPEDQLTGRKITRYIEALGSIPPFDESELVFRTEMQTRGRTEGGEVFLADVFFSTYITPAGPRLSALLVDASEDLREREETSLQQLLAGSRILVAAVSHEVRNVCGAIGMMHENLVRNGSLQGNQDFEALGSLVETLKKIAALELKQSAGGSEPGSVDLNEVLADLRIILDPLCEESEIQLVWNVPDLLPPVQADRHSLLQVLLNLTRNSRRALEPMPQKTIEVSVAAGAGAVSIRFSDNGPGIPPGRKLFQPLQRDADATGLGLYLSRAFMRSFRGDLRHDPQRSGCSFLLELTTVPDPAAAQNLPLVDDGAHTALTA